MLSTCVPLFRAASAGVVRHIRRAVHPGVRHVHRAASAHPASGAPVYHAPVVHAPAVEACHEMDPALQAMRKAAVAGGKSGVKAGGVKAFAAAATLAGAIGAAAVAGGVPSTVGSATAFVGASSADSVASPDTGSGGATGAPAFSAAAASPLLGDSLYPGPDTSSDAPVSTPLITAATPLLATVPSIRSVSLVAPVTPTSTPSTTSTPDSLVPDLLPVTPTAGAVLPEPSGLATFGLGVVLLPFLRRRRRKGS